MRKPNSVGPPPPGKGSGPTGEPLGGLQLQFSLGDLPVAITWHKGRPIILGKLLWVDGQLVLGTAYRWRLLPKQVSLPDLAVRLLLHLGVTTWLVRDDLRRLAWRVDLPRLLETPLQGGERYIHLDDAQRVPWCWWPFAEKSIDLLELAQALKEGRHLTLEGVGA